MSNRQCAGKSELEAIERVMMKPRYRILITKTLDVPKNMFTALYDTEEQAVQAAKDKLAEIDGDVAVVLQLLSGSTKVIRTFEKVRKTA